LVEDFAAVDDFFVDAVALVVDFLVGDFAAAGAFLVVGLAAAGALVAGGVAADGCVPPGRVAGAGAGASAGGAVAAVSVVDAAGVGGRGRDEPAGGGGVGRGERRKRSSAWTAPTRMTMVPTRNSRRLTGPRLTVGAGRRWERGLRCCRLDVGRRRPAACRPCACTSPASFLRKTGTPHRCSSRLLRPSGQGAFQFSASVRPSSPTCHRQPEPRASQRCPPNP
jgi:hypothetical protein